jgi:hypothetical protein
MDVFLGIVIISYWVGVFIAVIVIRARAGVGQRRIRVIGPQGFGLGWTTMSALAVGLWPIALIVWLARGRPEPRVVFNEKAVERKAAQAQREDVG